MPITNHLRILVALDDESDRVRIRSYVNRAEYELFEVSSIAEALFELERNSFACAIFGSLNIDELTAPAVKQSMTPIAWIVPAGNQLTEKRLLGSGITICWHRENLSKEVFSYCLTLLIENRKLQLELGLLRKPFEKRDLEHEVSALLSWYYRTTATAQSFGFQTVRESAPDRFTELTGKFAELIDQTIEEKTYKVQTNSAVSVNDMAQRLGLLNAGPRDVIEIYAAALRQKLALANSPAKARSHVDAARTVSLELMGHLVTYYKNLARLAMRSATGEQKLSGERTK